MQVRELPIITYQTLARKFKDTTVAAQHSPKGISILHVMPKNGSRLEPDIYTFDKDVLITSDVMLRTKSGTAKQIFTNYFTNGVNMIIREINHNLHKEVETTIDKTIIPLSDIRKSRKGGGVAALMDKASGRKVDGTIPVSITKKEVVVNEEPISTHYNIFANGQRDSVRIVSDNNLTKVIASGKWGKHTFDLGEVQNPQKKSSLNHIFDWFVKENNGLE